jgi:POT family proton-dependent oligopeptide transporter
LSTLAIRSARASSVSSFVVTKKSLGPIGDSPLLELPKSKRTTKEIAVYIGSIISIPLIFMMIKNTDYTDYFMYTIGPLAIFYFLFETYKEKELKAQKKLIAAFIFIIFSLSSFKFD